MPKEQIWEIIAHSYAIADTGDYDGHYELTNGNISLYTQHDYEEDLELIRDNLNELAICFYNHNEQNLKYEIEMLKKDIKDMHYMIENKLSWEDMRNKMLNEELKDNDYPF